MGNGRLAKPKATSKGVPAHHAAPSGAGELSKVWGKLSAGQQAGYRRIAEKYNGQHRKRADVKAAEHERHARYHSSAMTAKLENAAGRSRTRSTTSKSKSLPPSAGGSSTIAK
jgi:hypothetical protein